MKKLLLAGLSVLAILAALPLIGAVIITTSTQAAAECRSAQGLTIPSTASRTGPTGSNGIIGGAQIPGIMDASTTLSVVSNGCNDRTTAPITLGTLNLLGAGHTNGHTAGHTAGRARDEGSGGKKQGGFGSWETRLPGAMSALANSGITVAALQEVHSPQAHALATRYSERWGMYPSSGPTQNKVIWDRNEWTAIDGRLVDIPYFGGKNVGMPLVQLARVVNGTATGQTISVWSVHNPADTRGDASGHRDEALRRQLDTLQDLVATGPPTVIMGDFNDGADGQHAAHCVLTPTLTNAFGGSSTPCHPPERDASADHIYGANLAWAGAQVDYSTKTQKLSDHPLVVATAAGRSAGCALTSGATTNGYDLGPVKPQLTRLVDILAPMFAITTVGGYRHSATDPYGHPAGLAVDFMVPLTTGGRSQGQALADYAKQHASDLGVDYIIWYQQIWSNSRAAEGWRPMEDRGSATENHRDHVHINVTPGDPFTGPVLVLGATISGGGTTNCSEIVYPVPDAYVGNDAHNWHSQGGAWDSWHTGTDFAAPCGTPVYAAHPGTVEIDTTQTWAGPTLVKISTGARSLTTWYAHMQQVSVSRGQSVEAGQQIGMVGDEGNSYGCHLHFEVHLENGRIYGPDNVDPSLWLAENATAAAAQRALGRTHEDDADRQRADRRRSARSKTRAVDTPPAPG